MGRGKEFFKLVRKNRLEGIIAKKLDSTYTPGVRTKEWLKIKAATPEEFINCGYTKNRDSQSPFSSLVLGAYKGSQLVFIGQVGTGFNTKMQREIMSRIKPVKKTFQSSS